MYFPIILLSNLKITTPIHISYIAGFALELLRFLKPFGGKMEALANINLEVVFQLACIALIIIAGPAVIFVLAFRNGNL
jgi:hypothetical protein